MIRLADAVEIEATPGVIFEWFREMEANYGKWHPDHVRWTHAAGGFTEGGLCRVEEHIHGKLHKMDAVYTKIMEDRRIEYDFRFPMSLICPRGAFDIRPADGKCVFTATLDFRGGKLVSWLFRSNVEAVKAHMKEEGENLKRILEQDKGGVTRKDK